MKYILSAFFVATLLSGCIKPATTAAFSPQEVCETQIDHALSEALRSRAAEFAIEAANLARLVDPLGGREPEQNLDYLQTEAEFRGQRIWWDPRKGSMALAAQRHWKEGVRVLPSRPNFHHPSGDPSAFGWIVSSKKEGGRYECKYAVDYSANPAMRSIVGLPTAIGDLVRGMREVSVVASVSHVEGDVTARFAKSSRFIDQQIMRIISPTTEGDLKKRMSNPIVVGADTMRLIQGDLVEQAREIEAAGIQRVHRFWFEYDPNLDSSRPLFDWNILNDQTVQAEKERQRQQSAEEAERRRRCNPTSPDYGGLQYFREYCNRTMRIGGAV